MKTLIRIGRVALLQLVILMTVPVVIGVDFVLYRVRETNRSTKVTVQQRPEPGLSFPDARPPLREEETPEKKNL